MTLPILILSLPGCEERLAPLRDALSRLGLPHEVLPGVDARRGLPPGHAASVDSAAARRRVGREMTDREFGCALSHRAAYDAILARGWPGAIVLEDDARPLPGFEALARGAPPPPGLLQLHYRLPARVMTGPPLPLAPGIAARELAHPINSAVGYWVSRDAAASLRDAATPVACVADWPCDVTRLGAWIAVPTLIESAGLPSIIGGERNPRALGLTHPKDRAARFLTRDYWRRRWRKLGSSWLPAGP